MEGLKKSFLVRGNNIVGFSDKNFSTAPIGTVLSFAGQTAPHGYLLCNGASYKVADYPDLYAVIGNTYGGDTENFNVPNLVDTVLTMVYIIKAFHTNEGVDSGVSDDVINYIDGEIAKVESNLGELESALNQYPNAKYYDTNATTRLDCDNITDRVALVTASIDSYTQLHYPAKELLFIMTSKNASGDGVQKAISWSSQREWNRVERNGAWSAWTELATMDKVEDIPNTVIVSENTKVKLNSNCYYTVINGVCYVTLWGFTVTEAGQYVVNSSMPKTRLTMKGLCTYGSNGYEGGCAYVFYDGNGNNKLYVEAKTTNESLYGSFSYPVAE